MNTKCSFHIDLHKYLKFKRIIKNKGLKIGFTLNKMIDNYIKENDTFIKENDIIT